MDLLEQKYFQEQGKAIVRHPWELAREWIIIDILKGHYKNKNFQLVDVGCGDGYIVSSIAKAIPTSNFSGIDIELDEQQVAHMNRQSAVKFYKKLEEVNIQPSREVAVTFMDVLEHIEDDVAALQHTKTLVAEGSSSTFTYFITVPAFQHLFTAHDVFLKHFRRYTTDMLKNSLLKAGLKPVKLHYFFFSLFMARWLKKSLQKLTGKQETPDHSDLIWNYGKTAANVVAQILYAEFKLMRALSGLGIMLPGLSVFGMASYQKMDDGQ